MPKGIPRDKSTTHKIVHRLKIARGHLDKVIKMAADGQYCIDVINQSLAVQSALKQADQIILDNHLRTCAADSLGKGKKDEAIAEIMSVFKNRR